MAADTPNDTVPQCILKDIHEWMLAGLSFDDAVERLRLKTVPSGYVPKPWIPG